MLNLFILSSILHFSQRASNHWSFSHLYSFDFVDWLFSLTMQYSFYFLKYKFIYFNWRLITLQYCIGFAIHQHESATCSPSWTPLPPPSPYHPSGLSQCASPKHPVSCIKPGLVIRFIYDRIHVHVDVWQNQYDIVR